MSISLRIKELRNKKNLNQSDFANLLGVSQAAISHYEKNERIPNSDLLSKMADKLNVNLHWLLLGEGPMFKEEIEGDIGIIKIRINKINKMGIIEEGDEFIGIDKEILGKGGEYAGYRIESGRWKPEIEEDDIIIIDRIVGGNKWE